MQQAVRETAEAATQGTFDGVRAILTPEERLAIVRDIDAAAASATRAAIRSASHEFPDTLAPAIGDSVSSALESPRLHEAISRAVADAARAALISSSEVIEKIHEEEEGPNVIQRIWRLLVGCAVGLVVLGAVGAALLAWAVVVHRKAKRLGALTRSLLDAAAGAAAGKPWSDEMVAVVARNMDEARLRELRELMRQ